MSTGDREPAAPSPLDEVVAGLQELRSARGEPSYAEIASRIARLRAARGLSAAEARVGRTTVYDAFRPGRRRIDLDLVLDIVRSLGSEEVEIEEWRQRCLSAQRRMREAVRDADLQEADQQEVVLLAEPIPDPIPSSFGPRGLRFVVLTLLACVALNLLGRLVVDSLHLAIYLDMSGTAVASVLLGPWWGALVGATTNLLGATVSGPLSLPFGLVNVAGALVWGYGYHRLGMGRTLLRFLSLNVVAGVVCTMVATPILLAMGGFTAHDSSDVVRSMMALGPQLWLAVLSSNLLLSIVDKVVSGYIALVARELVSAIRNRSERVTKG